VIRTIRTAPMLLLPIIIPMAITTRIPVTTTVVVGAEDGVTAMIGEVTATGTDTTKAVTGIDNVIYPVT